MKNLRLVALVGAACGSFAVALYASPYVVLFFLSRALKHGDEIAVQGYLDAPSVRDSLRQQIREYIEYSSKARGCDAGWIELAKSFGGALTEGYVTDLTTGDNIRRFLKTGDLPLASSGAVAQSSSEDVVSKASVKYQSFDRVVVDLPFSTERTLTALVLTRSNIFDWKITGLQLDLALSDSDPGATRQKLSCGEVIARVEQNLSNTRNIPVANTYVNDNKRSPFSARDKSYTFALGGRKGYVNPDSEGSKRIWDFVYSDEVESYALLVMSGLPSRCSCLFWQEWH